jgi:hypothetical protein
MATIITDSIRLNDSGDTKPWNAREHGARHAAERGAHAKGQQLHVAGVDAHGLGGDFVFADGHPGAADARVLQAVADHDAEHHQHQEQVVVQRPIELEARTAEPLAQVEPEELDRVDLVHALGAVGDVDRDGPGCSGTRG